MQQCTHTQPGHGVPRRRGAREVRTNLHAVLLLQDVVQQRRLPRTQEAGQDRDREACVGLILLLLLRVARLAVVRHRELLFSRFFEKGKKW